MGAPIRFWKVCLTYDQASTKYAIKDLDLEIEPGEFFCLIGPSGSGKSTILRMIAGISPPTKGELEKPEHVGMVFQSGALLPWLTVWDNVAFAAKMQGFDPHKIHRVTHQYIHMVHLDQFAKRYPRQLSGGQRQRVGLARALTVESHVLLLDEPFSALDPLITDELHDELLAIWKETGKTMVMVSHHFEEAVALADRIGIVTEGRLEKILKVDLPRPRDTTQTGFVPLCEELREIMKQGQGKGRI